MVFCLLQTNFIYAHLVIKINCSLCFSTLGIQKIQYYVTFTLFLKSMIETDGLRELS